MDEVDRQFQVARTWVEECVEVDKLLDRMSEYRELRRRAVANGVVKTRLRMDDLLELAEDRVVDLKAKRLRSGRSAPAAPPATSAAPAVDPEAQREVRRLQDELNASRAAEREAKQLADRQSKDLAASRAAQAHAERVADHRAREAAKERTAAELARAERDRARAPTLHAQPVRAAPGPAASPHLRGASGPSMTRTPPAPSATVAHVRPDLRRSQPSPAMAPGAKTPTAAPPAPRATPPAKLIARPTDRAAAKPSTPGGPTARSTPSPEGATGVAAPKHTATRPPPVDMTALDRAALESVGRYIPTKPVSSVSIPDEDYPPEWKWTGYDLAIFRGRLGITQKVLAGQLGVEQGTISKAESKPKTLLGPALQVALKKAMDDFLNNPLRPRGRSEAARGESAITERESQPTGNIPKE